MISTYLIKNPSINFQIFCNDLIFNEAIEDSNLTKLSVPVSEQDIVKIICSSLKGEDRYTGGTEGLSTGNYISFLLENNNSRPRNRQRQVSRFVVDYEIIEGCIDANGVRITDVDIDSRLDIDEINDNSLRNKARTNFPESESKRIPLDLVINDKGDFLEGGLNILCNIFSNTSDSQLVSGQLIITSLNVGHIDFIDFEHVYLINLDTGSIQVFKRKCE